MKKTLFVKTTALPSTMTRRVLYPFVNIIIHYLKKLRSCYINWKLFVSPINRWTVFIPCSSTASVEKVLQKVEMCLTMCREQSRLTKKQMKGTNVGVLQKIGSWGNSLNSSLWVLSKRTQQRRPVVQCLQKELKKPEKLNLNWNY